MTESRARQSVCLLGEGEADETVAVPLVTGVSLQNHGRICKICSGLGLLLMLQGDCLRWQMERDASRAVEGVEFVFKAHSAVLPKQSTTDFGF